jgi:hypothetical protein
MTAIHAEPGDDAAVANARQDYAKAMQGHDVGLQNAMKIELSVQLAKEKARETETKEQNAVGGVTPDIHR